MIDWLIVFHVFTQSGIWHKGTVHLYKCSCAACWERSSFWCRRGRLDSSRRRERYLQHTHTYIYIEQQMLSQGEQVINSLTLPFEASRWANDDFGLSDEGRDPHVTHDLTADITKVTKKHTYKEVNWQEIPCVMWPAYHETCVSSDLRVMRLTCRAGRCSASGRLCRHTAGHFQGDNSGQSYVWVWTLRRV